jgi:hypothetical protein
LTEAAETENPLAAIIAADGKSIKVIEIMADAEGHAIIKPVDMPADASPYPLFKQFLTHKAAAIAIYYVPPNLHIPASFEPAKRLLYIVSGETTLIAGKDEHPCLPGTIVIFDGKSDLKARSGKGGYTAVKVQLAD